MRLLAITLLGLGLLAAIGFFALLGARPNLGGPVAAPAAPTRPPPPTPTVPSGAVVVRSISELQRDPGRVKPGQTLRLTVGQDELTARLREQLASQPDLPFRDPVVTLRPGQIVVSGKATAAGLNVDVVATGEPVVESGRVRIAIKGIDFGRVPVPGPVRDAIARSMNDAVARAAIDVPAEVTSVDVGQGELVVLARPR